MHRHFNHDAFLLANCMEYRLVQHTLVAVDVFDKTANTTFKSKVLLFALALVHQLDANTVIEER